MGLQVNISPRTIDSIKSTILSPALTSHFAVKINPPNADFSSFLNSTGRFSGNYSLDKLNELVILCSDATLPGSSLFTHEVTSDYPGVTEKMVYRRQYDDYSSFSFYVDQNYEIVEFFESWINFIVNENPRDDYYKANASYRMKFRDDYAGEIGITKFERNVGAMTKIGQENPPVQGPKMEYTFIKAYPISIDSMPVSYEGSSILKCNVNFTYLRYVRERTTK